MQDQAQNRFAKQSVKPMGCRPKYKFLPRFPFFSSVEAIPGKDNYQCPLLTLCSTTTENAILQLAGKHLLAPAIAQLLID